ncbi:hypothetical protein SRHO_G00317260 [Serrasalmus rhombeus]
MRPHTADNNKRGALLGSSASVALRTGPRTGKVAQSVLSASAYASAPKSSPERKSLFTVSLFLRRVPSSGLPRRLLFTAGVGQSRVSGLFQHVAGPPASETTRAAALPIYRVTQVSDSHALLLRLECERRLIAPGPLAESRAKTARLSPHMNHQADFPLELEFIRFSMESSSL